MHGVEEVRRRARRASPVVRHPAEREALVHLARVGRAALFDERKDPGRQESNGAIPLTSRLAWMHQIEVTAGQKSVVDEVILFQREAAVASREVAGAIAGHALTQGEVLRTSRRADRIRLHEPESLDGA